MAVLASIDVGSNAVRLLVARTGGGVPLVRLRYERTATRLAEGLSASGRLKPGNMELTMEAMKKYSGIISSCEGLSGMRAVGTSALREAENAGEFIRSVRQQTGINLEAITHEEEARLSALGVVSLLKKKNDNDALILDMGGGSTEWMLTRGLGGGDFSLRRSGSFPVGVVKLAGLAAKKGEAALENEISAFAGALKSAVSTLPAGTVFILTGGTASTLASIDIGLKQYDHEKVHGHEMGLGRIAAMRRTLSSLSLEQRRSVPGLEPDRADLIIPGLRLTIKIMEYFGLNRVISSDTGLPEGIVLDLDRLNSMERKKSGPDQPV